jgi:hypothetical protein
MEIHEATMLLPLSDRRNLINLNLISINRLCLPFGPADFDPINLKSITQSEMNPQITL